MLPRPPPPSPQVQPAGGPCPVAPGAPARGEADARHDFGASLFGHRCEACRKLVLNRGCGACGQRLCAAHFAGHRCPCKLPGGKGTAGAALPSAVLGDAAAAPAAALVDLAALSQRTGALPLAARYTARARALEESVAVQPLVLGTGASGAVRQGKHRGSARRCAVKSLCKSRLRGAELEAVKTEAEVHLSLDHPHVVRLEHVYETDDRLHLVMEHLEGGEIFDRVVRLKRFEEPLAIETLRQTLSAVAYLHAQQFCHLDLKVENFVYDAPDHGHVKLIDFGFAARLSPGTRMSQSCGSLHSVAPEVLRKDYDEKADLWSMGVMAYIILTGASPWKGSDWQVQESIRSCQPDYRSSRFCSLSQGARDFVGALLTKSPADRLSARQALGHPWLSTGAPSPERALGAGLGREELLRRLREHSQATPRQRAARYLLAWSLPPEQVSQARAQFLALVGADGVLTAESLVRLGGDPADGGPEALVAAMDLNSTGAASYTEFLAAAAAPAEGAAELLLDAAREEDGALQAALAAFDAEPAPERLPGEELGQPAEVAACQARARAPAELGGVAGGAASAEEAGPGALPRESCACACLEDEAASVMTRLASTATGLSESDLCSCGSHELDLAAEEALEGDVDRKPRRPRDRAPRSRGSASLPPGARPSLASSVRRPSPGGAAEAPPLLAVLREGEPLLAVLRAL